MKTKKKYICPKTECTHTVLFQLMAASENRDAWPNAKNNGFADWDDEEEDSWGDIWSHERSQWQQVGNSYELPHTKSPWDD